jgi:hypothetical protein
MMYHLQHRDILDVLIQYDVCAYIYRDSFIPCDILKKNEAAVNTASWRVNLHRELQRHMLSIVLCYGCGMLISRI